MTQRERPQGELLEALLGAAYVGGCVGGMLRHDLPAAFMCACSFGYANIVEMFLKNNTVK